MDAVSRRAA